MLAYWGTRLERRRVFCRWSKHNGRRFGDNDDLSIRHYLFRFECSLYLSNLVRESVYLIVKMVDATFKLINSIPKCTLKLLDSTLNSLKSRDIIIR